MNSVKNVVYEINEKLELNPLRYIQTAARIFIVKWIWGS